MQEISYKDLKFNPFNLIGGEWMLVTAGDENSCNTMTVSWGHLGCLWGQNDPTAVIYLRPSRYTKEFVDEEGWFSLCVMDKSFKKLYQSELQESGFLYQDTIDENYPQRDFHTMYVGKIGKVLVRDDEYLK
jgi:hypothetical protein